MTMVSREPRQIVAFEVDHSIRAERIQSMIDRSPYAENYYTDGGTSYLDVIFGGRHRRNIHSKSDTHIIESTNSDIRHYIAGFRRSCKLSCVNSELEE